ncbi:MAG: amidohydrolase family protein [Hydrogenophaga sp.]|jgi:L-fuconolactonase|uniref:amidohydrolase family protein n=1 Tax=Hydrogenophaga sp. TaxID=1904254 RepID=UPI00262A2FA6|nr:amidohydrolase family protein [Hydrogenophaga sp.]MCV0437703.1 amidohydrolase family protein [Hydrogenophaga sp.]
MRVDSHLHFWRPERGDYPWMLDAPPVLKRRYGPDELAPLLAEAGITATILVQAAPTVAETDYLLGIADAIPWTAGVVGWIDFERPDERGTLDRLAAHPKLVGVRPMVQDIADDDWITGPGIAWAFDALQERGLAFDALGYSRHARRFLKLCETHPDLRVVIDHGLKPAIARGEFEPWAADMRDLARNSGAFCKLSGLASEAAYGAPVVSLQRYADVLLETFGPSRLMWGSDWPVCTTAIGYSEWLLACETWMAPLDPDARARVFGANALAFYQIQGE